MLKKASFQFQKIYKELTPTLTQLEKYFLIILFALSLIYIFPLTLSGVLYDADSARTLSGLFNFSKDARHLSDLLFNIVTPGKNAVDLFPYTIIVSSIIVSYSGFLLLKTFYKIDHSLAKYVFSLTLLINPFFLGNLAFHFDSLTMSMSILFVAYSLIIDKDSNNILFSALSSLFLFLSLCFYQSSLNIYLIIGINIYFSRWSKGEFHISQIIRFFTKTSVSLVAYYLFAKSKISAPYQLARSATLNLDGDFLYNVYVNYINGMDRIKLAFFSKAGYILILIYIACVLIYVLNLYKNKININRIVITLSSVLLSIFFIYGFHSVFDRPPHYARNYMAFGAFNMLAIAYVFHSTNFNKLKTLTLALYLIYSFGTSAAYSNISKFQDNHIHFLSTQIAKDLKEVVKEKETILIGFSRHFPASQEYKTAIKGLPILELLIQKRLTPNWPNYEHFRKLVPNIERINHIEFMHKIKKKNLQPKIKRRDYSIYVDGDKYFIQTF